MSSHSLNPFAVSEFYVRSLIEHVWSSPSPRLPTFEKCSGRGKLLGEWLIPGLLESMDRGMPRATFDDLVLLTTILRTSVVIRDHLDDEWLTPNERECLSEALATLHGDAERRLREIGCGAVTTWRAAQRISRAAFDRFDHIGYAHAVAGKNIIAQVPVRLVALLTGATLARRNAASNLVTEYLWALQLVDDWQDRTYDATTRVNHNVFAEGRYAPVVDEAIGEKAMPTVIAKQIHGRLSQYRDIDSDIVRSFVINGVRQLRLVQHVRDVELTIDRFHARCETTATENFPYRESFSGII